MMVVALMTRTYSNSAFVWTICILIACTIASAAGLLKTNLFSKRMKNIREQTGFTQEHSSKSAINCAASCQQKAECQTFSFDKTTKTCRLGQASNGKARMYKQKGNTIECPDDKGYLMWVYLDAFYCLKYNAVKLVQPDARKVCEDDGGNLALIDSDLKRQRLHDIFKELTDATSGDYALGLISTHQYVSADVFLDLHQLWFDGHRTGLDTFMSWKSTELPGSLWLGGQPDNRVGEDCITGRWEELFFRRDAHCPNYQFKFFCEI